MMHFTHSSFIKTHFFRVFFAALLSLFYSNSGATTCTANSNGAWNVAGTWNCGHVPTCGDTIVIPSSTTVTNSTQQNYTACSAMLVKINGTLYFQNGFKLKLPCGSQVIISSGGRIQADVGGGNSNYIEICGNNMWNSGCGTINGPLVMPPYDCDALPVTLVSFSGESVKNYNLLHWTTSSEINNDYFSVERSKDGEHFEEIGRIIGAGNSTNTINYSFKDETPYDGVSYYRLRQVDYDGMFAYSDVVAVKFIKKDFASLIVQTDYDSKVIKVKMTSDDNGKYHYILSDALGNTRAFNDIETHKGVNEIIINSDNLVPGVYYFSIRNEHDVLTKKILY